MGLKAIVGILLITGMILFLLCFHIVIHSGAIALIPKEHLSFSETFVDVDKIIRQYNRRNFAERLRGEGVNIYLVRKLEEKGIIETRPSSTAEARITKSMYDRIQNGMNYSQVTSIIGQQGEEMTRIQLAGILTVMYMWQNDNGTNMNITFQNDKIVQKTQFGLR